MLRAATLTRARGISFLSMFLAAVAFVLACETGGGSGPTPTSPSISIVAPSGSTITGNTTVILDVSIPSGLTITEVEVHLGGTLEATLTSAPYETTIDTTTHPDGPATLSATAFASNGTSSTASREVSIDNTSNFTTPTIDAPTGPGTVSGSSPNFTATVQTGEPLNFSIEANDDEPGDTLTLTATVSGGTLSANAAGFSTSFPHEVTDNVPVTLNFAGTADQQGSIVLTFNAEDSVGISDTATLEITIVAAPVVPPSTGGSGGSTGQVTADHNGRAYRLHVPSSYSDNDPTPLVIALHGLGDDYLNFFNTATGVGWDTAADTHGFIFCTPENMNPLRDSFLHFDLGGNYSQPRTVREVVGVLYTAYYGIGADYNIALDEIYVIGFSEGAAVTELMGFWFSSAIRAIAPYAGTVTGKGFPTARDIPVYGIVGDQEANFTTIQNGMLEWQTAGHDTEYAWVQGVGHSFIGLNTQGPSPSDVFAWLSTSTADPVDDLYDPNGPSQASQGSGGATGSHSRTVVVSGTTHEYFLHVPSSYTSADAVPVMIAFHGAAGAGNAPQAAEDTRDDWSGIAESDGFIVVAQAATGANGGWVPADDIAVLHEIIGDLEVAYNIDFRRIYGWGFSAGGHLMHDIGIGSALFFAAYGVSAGSLQQVGVDPIAAGRVIPVDIHIGTSDPLHPSVSQDPQAFQNANWTLNQNLSYTEFGGGHIYTVAHLQAIWDFLSQFYLA